MVRCGARRPIRCKQTRRFLVGQPDRSRVLADGGIDGAIYLLPDDGCDQGLELYGQNGDECGSLDETNPDAQPGANGPSAPIDYAAIAAAQDAVPSDYDYDLDVINEADIPPVEDLRAPLAVIASPWAYDADGHSLPTYFQVNGNQIAQIVDTSAAQFPVVADPSVWWWATKIAGCALEVAAWAGAAAKLVSTLARAEKVVRGATKVASFYAQLGGKMDKVWTIIKKYVKDKSSLTKAQIKALEGMLKTVGASIFNILGIGTCWDMVDQWI